MLAAEVTHFLYGGLVVDGIDDANDICLRERDQQTPVRVSAKV